MKNKIDVRYFVRSGTWSMISEGVQIVSGLILAVIFTHGASKDVFGQFQLIVSVISLLAVVSLKGLDTVILRDAAKGNDGVYIKAVRLRYWWSWWGVPVLLGVGIYYWMMGQFEVGLAFSLAAGLVPLHYSAQSWIGWIKGKNRFDLEAKFMAVKSLINVVVVATVILLTRGDLVSVFVSYFVVQVGSNWLIYKVSLKQVSNDNESDDWKQYGYFLSIVGLFKFVMANIDKVLVALLISPVALANYTIAIMIPNYVQLANKSLLLTTSPRLSKRKYVSLRELVILLAFGLFLMLATLLTIKLFVPLLFGDQYRDVMGLAYIAAVATLLHPFSQYLVNFVNMTQKRKVLAVSSTAIPAIKLILILVLVTMWQEVGFVVAYALMSIVWAVVPLMILKIDWQRGLVG